jgi:hypothetical protein
MTVLNLTKKAIYQSTTAVLALIASVVTTSAAQAADFDFSGTFQQDNDVALFNFTVGQDSTVTLFSSSWLYGNPAPGQELGGFDPILALWDSNGNLLQQQDDGGNIGSTVSNGVSYNHGTWDSYFTQSLTAGSYIASVGQFNNFAVGTNLSQGFRYDSNPNFTFDNGSGGATQPLFNGVWDNNDPRTADWEFHVLNVSQATSNTEPVPEPASMLGILAFGALGSTKLLKRKQKQA